MHWRRPNRCLQALRNSRCTSRRACVPLGHQGAAIHRAPHSKGKPCRKTPVLTVPATPVAMPGAAAGVASQMDVGGHWRNLGACVVALATVLVVERRSAAHRSRHGADHARSSGCACRGVVAAGCTRAAAPLANLCPQRGATIPAWPQTPQPVMWPASPGMPVAQRAASICGTCGRVESVQAIEQCSAATGVGAVAGGVLGAVVGNQIGKGNGRTCATVRWARWVAGYAGHEIEKRTRTQTTYQVARAPGRRQQPRLHPLTNACRGHPSGAAGQGLPRGRRGHHAAGAAAPASAPVPDGFATRLRGHTAVSGLARVRTRPPPCADHMKKGAHGLLCVGSVAPLISTKARSTTKSPGVLVLPSSKSRFSSMTFRSASMAGLPQQHHAVRSADRAGRPMLAGKVPFSIRSVMRPWLRKGLARHGGVVDQLVPTISPRNSRGWAALFRTGPGRPARSLRARRAPRSAAKRSHRFRGRAR